MAPITILSKGLNLLSYGRVAKCSVHTASSLAEVLAILEALPLNGPRTLDLTGHARRGTKLLGIGRDTIDPFKPLVERFFLDLGSSRLLERLEVTAVRLMGCETASRAVGRRAMRWLARVLELPVYGTRTPIGNAHYDEYGFDPTFAHLLIDSEYVGDERDEARRRPWPPVLSTGYSAGRRSAGSTSQIPLHHD